MSVDLPGFNEVKIEINRQSGMRGVGGDKKGFLPAERYRCPYPNPHHLPALHPRYGWLK
jgi:hypothetical protein